MNISITGSATPPIPTEVLIIVLVGLVGVGCLMSYLTRKSQKEKIT